MKVRKLAGIGSILALSAAATAGCGSSSPTTASHPIKASLTAATARASSPGSKKDAAALEALYKKAVAAGQRKVVIYGPSAGTDTDMYKAFKKEFPKITITGVPVVGPPMSAKLSAEFSSGKHVADIAYTGSTNMIQYNDSKWLTDFKPVTAPATSDMEADNVGPRGSFYGVTVGLSGTLYNTTAVKSPPTRWTDFEKTSTYKGKIAMYDPTAIGEMEDVFAHLALVRADAGVEKALKADDVQLYPASSLTGPIEAVAQGSKEIAIEMPYAYYLPAKAGGAPVGFKLLKADNYTVTLYMGQVRGAPDPLASKLYEDWAFTSDAAKAINTEGEYSAVLGNSAPKGMPALDKIPQMPSISLSHILAADNAAIKKAQRYWS